MYYIHPVKLVDAIRSEFNLPEKMELNVYNDLNTHFHDKKYRVLAKENTLRDFSVRLMKDNSRFNPRMCELLYNLINN